MFTNNQLNRIENAVNGLRNDLRLKEQQDRIEAQQTRIETQLTELLVLMERDDMTPEQEAEVQKKLAEQLERMKGLGTESAS